jgi:hypothetical protein
MKEEQVNRYLEYYKINIPILDDDELNYFDCLFQSNKEYLLSRTMFELYDIYNLTRYLHYVVFKIHNPSHF